MKRIVMKRSKQISFPALLVSLLFLWSCGGGGAQRQVQEEHLAEVKESVSSDLYELRHDIMQRIAYVENQLEDATGEVEEILVESRDELQSQLVQIEIELKNVQEASLETWDSVLEQVTASVIKAQEIRNEVSLEVRELLEGED
jgi:phage-related minor tail protein